MKRLLLAYLLVRAFWLLLTLANGALPYGVDRALWQESGDGFHYRHLDSRYFDPHARWDGKAYLQITYLGYDDAQKGRSSTAFFPGYPWVVRAVHRGLARPLLPESVSESPVFMFHLAHGVSSLAFLAALTLIHGFFRRRYGEETALRAGLLLIAAPTSIVFSCVLSESVFLLLLIGAICLAEKKWYFAAVLLIAYAATVRAVGAMAAVPVALMMLEDARWDPRRVGLRWLYFLFVPWAILIVLLRMGEVNGNFLAYFVQQKEYFGHESFPDFTGIWEIVDPRAKGAWELLRDALQVAACVVAVAGGYGLWRLDRGRPYRLALCGLVAVFFLITVLSGALLSMPRYVAILFPLYAVFAGLLRGRSFLALLGASLFLQGALWLLWIHNRPVLI